MTLQTNRPDRFAPMQLLGTPHGRTFLWMWLGQTISMFGSHMTTFAFGVWLFRITGQATPLTLTALAGFLPAVVIGSFAGVVVDRLPRKQVLILSDLAQALASLGLLGLFLAGRAELLFICALLAVSSAASAFQEPAQEAAISALIPPDQLGRANGLLSFGNGIANVVAPIAAGALVTLIDVSGVIVFDLATFVFAAFVLLPRAIPSPQKATTEEPHSTAEDLAQGWRYLSRHGGLAGLMLVVACFNFSNMITVTLLNPTVLAVTNDSVQLGLVFAVFGVGGIVGGGLMAAWGGPKRLVFGVIGGIVLNGLLSQILFGLAPLLLLWLLASLANGVLVPILGGANRAIWQRAVPAELQGRVFALRLLANRITIGAAFALAGPLADMVFVPFFGTANGLGYRVMFLLFGALTVLIGLAAMALPSIRRVG